MIIPGSQSQRWSECTVASRQSAPRSPLSALLYMLCPDQREYWMIGRRLGFVVVVWFDSFCSPSSPPLLAVNCLSFSVSCVSPVQLTDGRGREGGGGTAKSYDGEIAWSSINHSKLWSLWIQWSLAYTLTDICSDSLNQRENASENASV